eukprot:PITA_10895
MTTPYHPQANGQVESSNKIVETILTKTVASHRRDWATRLPEALWAYITTWRSTTGHTPYQLMFGKQPIFPIEFEIQTLRTTQEVGVFHEGDWVLLYDSIFQDFPEKLQTRWLGPYEIQKVHDNGTLTLITIDGSGYTFKANGHRVRLYRKPLTRESFCQQLRQDSDMEILREEDKSPPSVTH